MEVIVTAVIGVLFVMASVAILLFINYHSQLIRKYRDAYGKLSKKQVLDMIEPQEAILRKKYRRQAIVAVLLYVLISFSFAIMFFSHHEAS